MRSLTSTLTSHSPNLEPVPRAGDLAEIDVVQLLRALHRRKSTGILTLESNRSGRRALYFLEGDIVAATTDVEDLRLGRFFYRSGHIERQQLEEALRATTSDHHLGEILVEKQFITAEERQEGLTAQFREILFSSFLLREGGFSYQPQEAIFADNLQLFFDTEELINEGVRLAEEVAILSRELDKEEHIYQRVGVRPALPLRREQEELLRLIDGRRSTAELFVLSPLERLPTIQLLSQLLEQGLIRKIGSSPRLAPEELPTYPLLPEEVYAAAVETRSPATAGTLEASDDGTDAATAARLHTAASPKNQQPDPQAGVFFSAQSVLDIVDLSHVRQYGIATDIPLDGIVEAVAAEEDEEHGLVATEEDEEADAEPTDVAEAAGEEEGTGDLETSEPVSSLEVEDDEAFGAIDTDEVHTAGYLNEAEDEGASWEESAGQQLGYPQHREPGRSDSVLTIDLEDEDDEVEALTVQDFRPPPLHPADEDLEELRPEDVADMAAEAEEEPFQLEEAVFSLQQPSFEPPPARDDVEPGTEEDELPDLNGEGLLEQDDEPEELAELVSAGEAPPIGFADRASRHAKEEVPLLETPVLLEGIARQTEAPPVEEISKEEMEVLASIVGIFQPRAEEAAPQPTRRPRRGNPATRTTARGLTTVQRGLLKQRAEIYNQIFATIFAHFARKSGRDRTRQRFQAFFAPGNSSYPELFIDLGFKSDGDLDAELLLRNLEAYPTQRPAEVLDAALNEVFYFLLRDIHQVLEPDEQSDMMDAIVQVRNLLFKKSAISR